jgi:hypothetical protein
MGDQQSVGLLIHLSGGVGDWGPVTNLGEGTITEADEEEERKGTYADQIAR